MIYSLPLPKIRFAALAALTGIVLASCGSYQSASYYDNDGIYSSDDQVTTERPQRKEAKKQETGNEAYTNYFGQQAAQYEEALDGEIFTDIDSYSSNSEMENDSVPQGQVTDYYDNSNDYAGYAPWGDNTTSVNINVYDNSWGFGVFGYGSPWLYTSDGAAVITILGDIATASGDGAVVMVDMQDIMAATVTEAMAVGVRPMATTTVTTIGIMATNMAMDREAMAAIQRAGAITATPIP